MTVLITEPANPAYPSPTAKASRFADLILRTRSMVYFGLALAPFIALHIWVTSWPLMLVIILLGCIALEDDWLNLQPKPYSTTAECRRWVLLGVAYLAPFIAATCWLLVRDGTLLVWALGLSFAADSAAYVVGRTIGGPLFWPKVSPKKTWSGVFGGVLGALLYTGVFIYGPLLFGWEAPLLSPWLLWAAIPLTALGIAGDLFESWLKRRGNVKDSGSIFPGHGGPLDRFDSHNPVVTAVAMGDIVLLLYAAWCLA